MVVLFTGCASTGKAILNEQKDPIALVSVVSNEDINWEGEPSMDSYSIGPMAKRAIRADPDLEAITSAEELINTAETIIRNILVSSGVNNLAERDTVLRSTAYQNVKIKKYPKRDMVKPDGYLFADSRDKNFPAALAAETGIQHSIFIEFNFVKSIYSGLSMIGTCRAMVDMTVLIIDAGGKTIYRKTLSLPSMSAIKVSNGVYSHTELYSLFQDTITNLCLDFMEKFEN